MASVSRNKLGYDLWSSSYDEYPNPLVFVDDLVFPSLWNHIRDLDLLEIGCGTGRHTVRLVQQGNHVTGIDLSHGMLSQARKKAGLKGVALIEGDFLQEPSLKENSFDAVVCSLVMEHMLDLHVFFQRVSQLLRCGGQAFFSDIHFSFASLGKTAHFKDPRSGNDFCLESKAHSKEAVLNALRSSGLELQATQEFKGTLDLEKRAAKWAKLVGFPLLQTWTVIKPKLRL